MGDTLIVGDEMDSVSVLEVPAAVSARICGHQCCITASVTSATATTVHDAVLVSFAPQVYHALVQQNADHEAHHHLIADTL